MFEEYFEFNVKKFLTDHYEKLNLLPKLETELNVLDGMGGTDYTQPRGGTNISGLDNVVIAREKVHKRIKEIKSDIDICCKALERLNSDELYIIELFHVNPFLTAEKRLIKAEEHGYNKYYMYKIYNVALAKIKKTVFN